MKITEFTNVQIANTIRDNCSQNYKDFVPEVNNQLELQTFYGQDGFYPTYANEFLNVMTNLIVVQRVFNPLSFTSPFNFFYRTTNPLGDTEEIVGADIMMGEDYEDSTDPFSTEKPIVKVSYIQTRDKKVWTVGVKQSILRGAFSSEGGLGNLLSQIMGKLRIEKEMYLYTAVNEDLQNIPHGTAIPTLTYTSTTESAKLFWKYCISIVKNWVYPSRLYNAQHVMANTSPGNFVLVLNNVYQSVLDVEVIASLFNSAEIGANKYFERIITLPLKDLDSVGIIMDRETYLIVDRIITTTEQFNARTLQMNYMFHNWIKRGLNPLMQSTLLLDNTKFYTSPEFAPNDFLHFTNNATVTLSEPDELAQNETLSIFYTTNGAVPTVNNLTFADGVWTANASSGVTKYTNAGIAIDATTTISAIAIQNVETNYKISKPTVVTYTKVASTKTR